MSAEDRNKWDVKYGAHTASSKPSSTLVGLASQLPERGRALDVAGGAGRHAIWLAERGLDVTLVDISSVGIAQALERAKEQGVTIDTIEADLEQDAFPAGPWELIVFAHYLQRSLYAAAVRALSPGGILVALQPTLRNLERHNKPPARFLLDEGELPSLVGDDLQILQYEEGWLGEGRHDAVLVGRAPPK